MARSLQRNATSILPQPTEAEVRAHLDILLRSEALAISERNRRFLTYIVDETLAGRGDRIKAYNVALTAFDRTDDFDPQTDPIVRIEASRLRRALEHYYLTAGKTDAVRIAIPKGSYVANFSTVAPDPIAPPDAEPSKPSDRETETGRLLAQVPARRSSLWPIAAAAAFALVALAWLLPVVIDRAVNSARVSTPRTSLLVLPFEASAGEDHALIARGITAELIGRLMPIEHLAVLGEHPATANPGVEPDYILSGSAHAMGDKIYISAVLADLRTGRYLWTWNVERNLTGPDLIGTETAIAGEIADGIKPVIRAPTD